MAEAAIEERQLLKSLRWYDGFVIALCNPGFLIGFVGYSFGTLGAWGAMALWGISAGIGFLQNWIYSETAAMFPEQSGGISLYAHEGWRRYFTFVGPVATFGYWIGWSVVLSIFGKLIGDLVISKWFPGSATHVYFSIGNNHLGPSHMIAIGLIIGVWLFNVFGVKPSLVARLRHRGAADDPALRLSSSRSSGATSTARTSTGRSAARGAGGVAFVWLFLMAGRPTGSRSLRASRRSTTTRSGTPHSLSARQRRSRCSSTSSCLSAWSAPPVSTSSTSRAPKASSSRARSTSSSGVGSRASCSSSCSRASCCR